MKILLVDDDADDLFLARTELERLGHHVAGAVDGAEALSFLERERVDVVITDIHLPGMDGFALTRAVQQRAAPNWQPVLFLSGHRNEELEVRALETGADGYVLKPVSAGMLAARLQVIERLLDMQRQAGERARELADYYAAEQEEKRIAEHLVRHMVNADKLSDAAVRYRLPTAESFSGDLVAAARTPGNVLHVLLADGGGHGLPSSINVLPIIGPFYSMTEKGFGLDAIVREMNAKVRAFLPENRFVAATLAAIDFREAYVRVWNGGNPPPFMLAENGAVDHVFRLRHLPLGVLTDDELETLAETRGFADGSQLYLHSDGLMDAEDDSGERFGFARLAAAIAEAPSASAFAAVVDAVSRHTGNGTADGGALLAIDCRVDVETADNPPVSAPSPSSADAGTWRFSLRLGSAELRQLDVVPLLLGLVNQFEGAREHSGELFVILSELFNNALDHGLLGLDSHRKLEPDGMGLYLDERQKRLAALATGQIDLEMEQFGLAGRAWLRVVCRDSGPGFDHAAQRNAPPAADDLPFGRGLALVRHLAAGFELNEAGNAATVMLALSPADGGNTPEI